MICVRLAVAAYLLSFGLFAGPSALAEPAPAPRPVAQAQPELGIPAVLDRPADLLEDTRMWRDRLLAVFDEGVLSDEAKRERGIVKWTKPVDVSIRGDAADRHAEALYDLLDELSALTGVTTDLHVNQNWAGDIDIYITDLDFYRPFFLTSDHSGKELFTCAAMPWHQDGVLRRSTIKINAGAVGDVTAWACVLEEVVQSFGLMGEVDGETDTILHDGIGYAHLGIVDRVLIRTLYDARLRPGMSRQHALPVAREIIGEQLKRVQCTARSARAPRRCIL
ncbi:MAG: DUF2927 domain-containing protein [Geminicoccaceae bacterium]